MSFEDAPEQVCVGRIELKLHCGPPVPGGRLRGEPREVAGYWSMTGGSPSNGGEATASHLLFMGSETVTSQLSSTLDGPITLTMAGPVITETPERGS